LYGTCANGIRYRKMANRPAGQKSVLLRVTEKRTESQQCLRAAVGASACCEAVCQQQQQQKCVIKMSSKHWNTALATDGYPTTLTPNPRCYNWSATGNADKLWFAVSGVMVYAYTVRDRSLVTHGTQARSSSSSSMETSTRSSKCWYIGLDQRTSLSYVQQGESYTGKCHGNVSRRRRRRLVAQISIILIAQFNSAPGNQQGSVDDPTLGAVGSSGPFYDNTATISWSVITFPIGLLPGAVSKMSFIDLAAGWGRHRETV